MDAMEHSRYKGQRLWEVEAAGRQGAVLEENLAGNLEAAGVAGPKAPGVEWEAAPGAVLSGASIHGLAVDEAMEEAIRSSQEELGNEERAIQQPEQTSRIGRPTAAGRDVFDIRFHDAKVVEQREPSRVRSQPRKPLMPRGRENDLGWRCSHLKDCDAWNREHEKYVKGLQDANKKKNLRTRSPGPADAQLKAWGASAARVFAKGDLSCPQISNQSISELQRAVRNCCRYILAQNGFMEMKEVTVRSLISSRMGITTNQALNRMIQDEVKYVATGRIDFIMQGFSQDVAGMNTSQAGTSAQQEHHQALSARKQSFKVPTSSEMESLKYKIKARGWGNSKLDIQIKEKLWEQLHKIASLRTRVSRVAVDNFVAPGGGSTYQQSGPAPNAKPPTIPLVLNLELFAPPGAPMGQLRPTSLRPSLTVERHGTVGTVTHEYRFPLPILEVLPRRDRPWRFGSCAVVGNSGSVLRGTRYGASIDAADAVLRVNLAPTHEFERFVGSKTTFDLANLQHAQMLLEGRHRSTRLLNSTLILFEVTKPAARESEYLELLQRFSGADLDRGHVAVLSPHFVSHALQTWGQLKDAFDAARHGTGRRHTDYEEPDSGFFATMFALQVCRHVHLYGMSNWREGSGVSYHYFRDKAAAGEQERRSFRMTREFLRTLATWPGSDSYGQITLHKP